MEDIWKKFKDETKEHVEKINEFLNEKPLNEKSQLIEPEKHLEILNNETSEISQPVVWREASKVNEQVQQIVLEENEKSKESSRKEVYGKMRDLVKEIMEKENVSRAQAYRRAKKRLLENSQ